MLKFKQFTTYDQLLLRLTYCEGIGIIGKGKILKQLVQHKAVNYSANQLSHIAQLNRTKHQFIESFTRLTDEALELKILDQQWITYFDPRYPKQLKEIHNAPCVLFYKGDIELLNTTKCLGVVGAREATTYAYRVVQQMIPAVVESNIITISGLAKGVDCAAHYQTLTKGGKTIGVVACGLDYCYPKEAVSLFNEMCQTHLVLSEHPKGIRPKPYFFPMRNRIIAGIADALCVIEAKQRSGALITAQLALEYGKDVFAVPGDILSGQSHGCHELILDGAICTTSGQQIVTEAHFYR
ncbi:DNA-processing protein DprA [Enterococcus bulliens]